MQPTLVQHRQLDCDIGDMIHKIEDVDNKSIVAHKLKIGEVKEGIVHRNCVVSDFLAKAVNQLQNQPEKSRET